MVCNSIWMLRKHNKHLPVRVYLLKDQSQITHSIALALNAKTTFDTLKLLELCRYLNVEVREVSPYQIDEPYLKDYFFINRIHFASSTEDSVLHIDGDTFIWGDIEPLFDLYTEAEMAVPRSQWIKQRFSCKSIGRDIDPFNAGVMLFNKGLCKKWAEDLLPYLRKTYTAPWFDIKKLAWEEMATNWWAIDNVQNIQYFKDTQCFPLRDPNDLNDLCKSLIIHTYVSQWEQAYRFYGKPMENKRKY